ncbi:MAG TPA: prolyl oligopeptidase family serine peptidase [Bacteroidales bacterium]|nr:prolyl oligopeptidase family serine peptidase [Bacteroidales bacterium]
MKKLLISLTLITVFVMALNNSCNRKGTSRPDYPVTDKVEVTEDYFGTKVTDPYRWLEDDMSEKTAEWVKQQNKLTFTYLSQIPYRGEIKNRLEKLYNYEKFTSPYHEGDYMYFSKNDGLQNQYVIYRQKGNEKPELFLDPNKFSEDGTTSLGEMDFSEDGSLCAYSISEGGSDWRKVIVMDALKKQVIEDTLTNVKFSGLSWFKQEGFYYSSYDKPEGSQLSAMTDHHKLYYHKLGTKQSDDKVVFGNDVVRRYVGGYVTEDNRYLVITASVSTTGNELYIKDLSKPDSKIIPVVTNFDNDHSVIDNDGTKLFIVTNLNAPNRKIVTVDASDPVPAKWVDFIPETENVLEPATGAGFFYANYMIDALSKVRQYDRSGKLVREITLPGQGTAAGFSAKKTDKEVYFTFTNYITPPTIFRLEPVSGTTDVFRKPQVNFDGSLYESRQVFYNSKDGTRVPMIITYRKGASMNGQNPTILYGYGGFNISETPAFSATIALWLKLGGIFAVPNIRGGGEYGEKWHLAGTKMNKQNVFDDFIAAAEYLIAEKYTSTDYLAIRGGSNGGLLVGAVMTQRPDLMKVALPAVGVLDMLRYHKFTAGAGWAYDYGTADDSKEMFDYLYRYSPVHNVKAGTSYPATLITTGDHDDRVVPAHSFKFAAQLQDKQAGSNPVLIRIETKAGHGAGTPVSKTIEQYADIYAFTLYNMGIKELPKEE